MNYPNEPVIIEDYIYPISTSKTPGWEIGRVGYRQTGLFGESKGLLLSLTNTPNFIKSLQTSNGLQGIM